MAHRTKDDETTSIKTPTFDGNSLEYDDWARRMQGYMRQKQLWKYIRDAEYSVDMDKYCNQTDGNGNLRDDTATEMIKQEQIYGLLLQNCSGAAGAIVEQVVSERGIDAWIALERKYRNQTKIGLKQQTRALVRLRLGDKEDIDEYFIRAERIKTRMQEILKPYLGLGMGLALHR